KARRAASVALPSTAGAVTATTKAGPWGPSYRPPTRSREAPGLTRTATVAAASVAGAPAAERPRTSVLEREPPDRRRAVRDIASMTVNHGRRAARAQVRNGHTD